MSDQEKKPEAQEENPEADLSAWAAEKGLTFEQFCESVFITAISLGLLNMQGKPVNKKEPKPFL